MRDFLIRSAKTVLPTATAAGVAGYLFAQGVGAYAATDRDSGQALAETLAWRLPFTMVAWCGGMVLVFEVFRSLWSPKPKPGAADPKSQGVDAEQLLLQLLEQAEAAEERRSAVLSAPAERVVPAATVTDDTPPPLRTDPLPIPDLQFPVAPPGS